jgi:hypothetical protein
MRNKKHDGLVLLISAVYAIVVKPPGMGSVRIVRGSTKGRTQGSDLESVPRPP